MDKTKGRLTLLADGIVTGKGNTIAENGFSVYIETDSATLLFDTGTGSTIMHNSFVYSKKLDAINKVVLSHGHADHTGGLPQVLLFHERLTILGHPDVFLNRFREPERGNRVYGGIPYVRGYLEKSGAEFQFNTSFLDIDRAVYLTGEIPRETSFEIGDRDNRWCIRGDKVVVDEIRDDQALIIDTKKGLIILLGCAHSGAINTINYGIRMTGTSTIHALIGGTHLAYCGINQVEKTIQALKEYEIEHLVPAHCTGLDAVLEFVRVFEDRCIVPSVGMVFEF